MKKIFIFFFLLTISFANASISCSEHYCIEQIALTSANVATATLQTSVQEPIVQQISNADVGYLQQEQPKTFITQIGQIFAPITGLMPLEIRHYCWWILLLIIIIIALLLYYRKKIREWLELFHKKVLSKTEVVSIVSNKNVETQILV